MSRRATEKKSYSKSIGQSKVYDIVRGIFPESIDIKQDVNLRKYSKKIGYSWKELSDEYGSSLAPIIADIVVFTNPLIIIEYNGKQHYTFTAHWHGDKEGFKEAQERDNQKIWWCQRMMVPLIVIDYNEEITIDLLNSKIETAKKEQVCLSGYSKCNKCNGLYLNEKLTNSICLKCIKEYEYSIKNKEKQEIIKKITKEKEKEYRESNTYKEKELAYKEKQKQYQKEKMKAYKESESYIEKQEEYKQRQKEYRKKLQQKFKNK